MKDDAIAPVIAVMLILAAIVTFYSIWNAIYVPSMKESAEVDHLHNVETAFVHFSSDLYFASSSHQDHISFSEPVQLGGGDTLVNQIKSSGALSVQNENAPAYNLTFTDSDGGTTIVNGTLVNFSYQPVSNFWQDQGYTWQYGYLNVTKNGGTLSTPLNYYTMADVENDTNTSGTPLNEFASSLGSAKFTPYTSANTSIPVITGIYPTYGNPTIPVIISGSGFNNDTGEMEVYFGNNKTSFIIDSFTQINATAPDGSGTVNITITTTGGTSANLSAGQFTYGDSPTTTSPLSSPSWTGHCSSISLTAVNLSASSANFVSSNGYGSLSLTTNATQLPLPSSIRSIAISSDGSPFGDATLASWNKDLADLANGPCSNSITNVTQPGWQNYTYTLNSNRAYPTNVNLTVMQVTVGAH
jgi:hypothetical protein